MTHIYVFPGQGSQKVGMGVELFREFPQEVAAADKILGYSIEELCLEDPKNQLNQTDFTQPALYVANALSYLWKLQDNEVKPGYVAGHSLGEYNALFVAGVFDFETGLKLVQKRGALMAEATGGGMAAIIGLKIEKIKEVLQTNGLESIDIANLNGPEQTVISGPEKSIQESQPHFESAGAKLFIPLKVSGAFHSRYMKSAQEEFEIFLKNFEFSAPQIPVIANVSASPYSHDQVESNLSAQIISSVRWTETVEFLLKKGKAEFEEVGPGNVLTGMIRKIKAAHS